MEALSSILPEELEIIYEEVNFCTVHTCMQGDPIQDKAPTCIVDDSQFLVGENH